VRSGGVDNMLLVLVPAQGADLDFAQLTLHLIRKVDRDGKARWPRAGGRGRSRPGAAREHDRRDRVDRLLQALARDA
jgi:hypothetical protein